MKNLKSERSDGGLSEEFKRFEAFAKELISVPNAEIDKRAREYERQRQKRDGKKTSKTP